MPPADTAALPSAARTVGNLTPPLQPYTSTSRAQAASRPRHRGVARQSNFKQRAALTRTVVRTKPLAAPTRCAEPPRPSGRRRPKQKRWERTPATDQSDQADVALRPTKRPPRVNPETPPAALWDRWRRMEAHGAPTEAENLMREEQRDTIEPRLNKTFTSESDESKG